MKRSIAFLIFAALLTGCADSSPRKSEQTAEALTSVTETTEPSATASTSLTTLATTSSTTASIAEIVSDIPEEYPVYDARAVEYLTELEKCEELASILDLGVDGAIADLDNNGSPELVVQIGALITISAVFGIDENGAYLAEMSEDSFLYEPESDGAYSYFGVAPVGYTFHREPHFFAKFWNGGSVGGVGGWVRLILSNREIKTEAVAHYSYSISSAEGYYYDGFENEEEYNKYIEDYFPRYEDAPCVKFSLRGVESSEYRELLLQQLDSYFKDHGPEASFASYLSAYTERNEFPPYGILIEDINGDGQDEMVMHINPFGNLDILYMKDGVVKVLNCEVMSQWGHTWYDSDKNRIINEYFHGHTEGTAGAYEYYVYDWDGEDYVLTMHLERESGYFEREADGVTKTDNFIYGQSYLNGVEISNERFEELHAELATPMTSVNHLDMIPSGAFETDETIKKEQEEQYNAYLKEKLYAMQTS